MYYEERRVLPYDQQQVFDLVADVGSYPLFLPGCRKVNFLSQRKNQADIELVIEKTIFLTYAYISRVVFTPPFQIDIEGLSGPFKSMRSVWKFNSCFYGTEILFKLVMDAKGVLSKAFAMTSFFEYQSTKMLQAFEERAHQLNREDYKKTL